MTVAMRPGFAASTTIRVDMNTASATECVTKNPVNGSVWRSASRSTLSLSRVIWSSAPKGSSSNNISVATLRARDRDPHPHASGQLSGVLAGRVPEDHDFKHVLHALGAPGRRIAAEQQRQLDVSATFRQGIRLASWKTNNISSRASAGIIPSTTSSPRSVPSGPRSVAAASTSRSRWIRSDRQTTLAWRRD
jgi:hypothetical protein